MPLDTSPEHPAPVRRIASAIGGWIERLGAVWVEGQLTQVSRRERMNTVFMTLRDRLADVSVTLTCPRAVVDSLPAPLTEGARVVVYAKPSYYPNRGTLSLQVREIRLVGEGELLARLERLRRLLAAEGLFAAELKRSLPFLPSGIGLVTAQGSAAERDVVEGVRGRWPAARFMVRHCPMQGVNCAREVIDALGRLDADTRVDVIVVARGGGSVEDLLPFSDEGLVRCVAGLATPVVSAIGHEPDSPILDLVADLRASTPTDAAKRVVPDVADQTHRVRQARERIRHAVHAHLTREQQGLAALRSRPCLADPRLELAERGEEVVALRGRTRRCLDLQLDRSGEDLAHQLARVRALSPLATLRRGYAVLSDPDGHALSSVHGIRPGADLLVRLADGRLGVRATDVQSMPVPDGPAGDGVRAGEPTDEEDVDD